MGNTSIRLPSIRTIDLDANHVVDRVNIQELEIGHVDVTVINGFGKNGKVFAIHGESKFVRNEWIKVGEELASAHGLAVYIPNLHSNNASAPNQPKAVPTIEYLIFKHYKLNDVLLCGKSWGSEVAAKIACKGNWVRAIILTNPVNKEHLKCIHENDIPLLYATNENDHAKNTMELYKKEWDGDRNLVTFVGDGKSPALINPKKLGGHMMSQSFIEPILEFVKEFYLKQ